jgi:ParB-like chromosome segregation protein Spo0J
MAEYHKNQAFKMERLNRSVLVDAPYNPRTISDAAKKKLKANLKAVGLVAPITWNKTTGHILSGHQRLAILDSLAPSSDYDLDVAVVEMDEATEKAQNIFLNNFTAQGDFDDDKLEDLLAGIDADLAGFDMSEMAQLTGELTGAGSESVDALSAQLQKAQDEYKSVAKKIAADERSTEFYLVVVFRNYAERVAFAEKHGLPQKEFISADQLEGKLLPLAPASPPRP